MLNLLKCTGTCHLKTLGFLYWNQRVPRAKIKGTVWCSKRKKPESRGEYFLINSCMHVLPPHLQPLILKQEIFRVAFATSWYLVLVWAILDYATRRISYRKQNKNGSGEFWAWKVSQAFLGFFLPFLSFLLSFQLLSLSEYSLGTHLPKNWLVPKRSSKLIAYRDDVSFALGYINLDFSCFIL